MKKIKLSPETKRMLSEWGRRGGRATAKNPDNLSRAGRISAELRRKRAVVRKHGGKGGTL